MGPAQRHALTEYAGLPSYPTKNRKSCSLTERTRFRVRHPLRNMGACAIGQAHDQELLPLVLGAA